MHKIANFLNTKINQKIIFSINLIMCVLSFKEIFWRGKEIAIFNLNGILLLPFVYSYSILATLTIAFFYKKERSIIIRTFGYILIIFIFLYPFTLVDKYGLKVLTIPFFLAVIEIIRNSEALGIQIKLLVVTFILLFVAGVLAKILSIEKSQIYLYGGLYYFYLLYKDFKHFKTWKNLFI